MYELDSEGGWIDQGTGQVECCIVPPLGNAIVVKSETEENGTLLLAKVHEEDIYERQGGGDP